MSSLANYCSRSYINFFLESAWNKSTVFTDIAPTMNINDAGLWFFFISMQRNDCRIFVNLGGFTYGDFVQVSSNDYIICNKTVGGREDFPQ